MTLKFKVDLSEMTQAEVHEAVHTAIGKVPTTVWPSGIVEIDEVLAPIPRADVLKVKAAILGKKKAVGRVEDL